MPLREAVYVQDSVEVVAFVLENHSREAEYVLGSVAESLGGGVFYGDVAEPRHPASHARYAEAAREFDTYFFEIF